MFNVHESEDILVNHANIIIINITDNLENIHTYITHQHPVGMLLEEYYFIVFKSFNTDLLKYYELRTLYDTSQHKKNYFLLLWFMILL